MIIVMRHGASRDELDAVLDRVRSLGLEPEVSTGEERSVVGVKGSTARLSTDAFEGLSGVLQVIRVGAPHKLASREWRSEDTVVSVGGEGLRRANVGGGELTLIAGPCAVEGREPLEKTAGALAELGAHVLRGGAFKPRTSPYEFQGLGEEGVKLLAETGHELGLPVVTEARSAAHVEVIERHADMIQVGARSMQNFDLLREVGRARKPVLLKRGIAATVAELLMSAEYILAEGNPNVVLCERGIRTFETSTRFTLDVSAVPVLKAATHLPVIVDPSHAAGKTQFVAALARAGVAAGADGIIVEVHAEPAKALCDGGQALTPDAFGRLRQELNGIVSILRETSSRAARASKAATGEKPAGNWQSQCEGRL
jgi:3-deoxy-7-phosphoheptulonate synthase